MIALARFVLISGAMPRVPHRSRMPRVLACVALLGALVALRSVPPAWGTVYVWQDENGEEHFSDDPAEQWSDESVPEGRDARRAPADPAPRRRDKERVVMYGAEWCVACRAAQAYFTRNRIPFVEYDIDHSAHARAEYERLGAKGIPVIFVGSERFDGFDPERFDAIFGR